MTIKLSSRTIFLAAITWWFILQFVGGLNTWETSTFLIAGMSVATAYKYIWEKK